MSSWTENGLDLEWVELIREAYRLGLTPEEVREYLNSSLENII